MPETDNVLFDFSQLIEQIIKKMTEKQADILVKRISTAYVLGIRIAKAKTKSVLNSAEGETDKSNHKMTELQRRAIQKLIAENLGYIQEFNHALGRQLEQRVKQSIAEGKGYAQIRKEMIPYIEETFGDSGQVTIDHTGEKRYEFHVSENGTISKVEKEITKPYSASVRTYSDLLSRTVVHRAFEKGRITGYQESGFKKWQFVGPIDNRSRPHHARLVGQVFEYDTEQSDLAQQLLEEINCRHRQIPVFENEKLNTPPETFEAQKEKIGLKFENGEWTFGD